MNIICPKEDCTGCYACMNVCGHAAITMEAGEEGFARPVINQSLCVDCGLCVKTCPVNIKVQKHDKPITVYSGWSMDEHTRVTSASGGAFAEIARYFLKVKQAVVFGVGMNEKVEAAHIFIERLEDLPKLQGSKYVQSDVGWAYKEARQFLRDGRNVLFSGTPCQIAGLRNFLRKDYENLFTVDLICHGVPTPKLLEDYKSYISNKINDPVRDIYFRCKKSSWIFFNMAVNSHVEKNGSRSYDYEGSYYADPFIRGFLRDNAIRPNCYHCQYTDTHRVSDFTLADWWGYKAVSSKDADFEKKGVSLIMCNTAKAVEVAKSLNMELRQRSLLEAIRTNTSLIQPFNKPATREEFWEDYRRMSFQEMIAKWMAPEKLSLSQYIRVYGNNSLPIRFLGKFCSITERVINKLHLPQIKLSAK